jgi:N-acetylglucosaminyldiphosphoundecaprenol N-acetyl-beta-D-mannosaminyltransferase
MNTESLPRGDLLDITFTTPAPDEAVGWILGRNRGGYVCLANVHVTMEARDDASFAGVLAGAWMVLPDGKPVAFALRRLGFQARQVRGPTLAEDICSAAARAGVPIGLYGGRPEVIARLLEILPQRHPGLLIAYAWSPPFRTLTEDEQAAALDAISASTARVLLVGLGCPKQERWMARYHTALNMPLVGVGAWFDFSSGTVREAPVWLQRAGFEWLHRLCQQPGRLWRRYAIHNPRFCWLVGRAWLRYFWTRFWFRSTAP